MHSFPLILLCVYIPGCKKHLAVSDCCLTPTQPFLWVCVYAKFLFMYLKRNPKNIKTPLIIEHELCIQIDTFYVTIKQSQYMFLISSI
jgi:hypothetical protein